MVPTMSDYIFIYGTLAPERAPADVRDAVSRMKPIAAGMMTGQLYDLGDFPGAVFDETARSQVRGQVYELPTDGDLLQKLGAYEEYDRDRPGSSLFIRE